QRSFTGPLIVFTTEARKVIGGNSGAVQFVDQASATSATFINQGGIVSGATGGETDFFNTCTADLANITNEAGVTNGALGGTTYFTSVSTAASCVITAGGAMANGAGGGLTIFENSSKAAEATLIASGGLNGGGGGIIQLIDKSDGGRSRVMIYGNGSLDVSGHSSVLVTIGSIEGDGQVILGTRKLSVGSNNLSATFSGVIQDAGSLTKIGSGTLTLSGTNLYTGGTTISAGALVVSNKSGSGTGTGAISVNAGTLGGSGIISGAVTVSANGVLAPAHGTTTQATLTIQSSLTFSASSTYTYTFNAKGKKAKTDKVIANGVTIASGASFNLSGTTKGTLTRGLTLTVISNTSASPISGTFSNLADGAIVTVNGNNLQASYEGGDGNDLTLTVVP
ncbi:MAG: autotransporter-associated beta strand repeat-containing protein, partial [Chthoniobacterales bacterium]